MNPANPRNPIIVVNFSETDRNQAPPRRSRGPRRRVLDGFFLGVVGCLWGL